MTDKELIQKEIDKIQNYIETNRYTGRTYRIANQIIDQFFNEPMGTEIAIVDHSGTNRGLFDMVTKRIKNDFPNIKFTTKSINNNTFLIKRVTPSFKENAYGHIEAWKKRMADYDE